MNDFIDNNFEMNPIDDGELILPESFEDCLSYEQQFIWLWELFKSAPFTADATVDNNVGIPSVDVTKEVTEDSQIFHFAFHNIKGQKGDRGERGPQGEQGIQGIQGETGATPDISVMLVLLM